MSHTPTPWDLYNAEDCLIIIPHTKGEFPLRVMSLASEIGDQEDYDNAAYIVQAVNSYQAMKEALEGILKLDLTTWDDTGTQLDEAIDKAQQALTLANGGSTDV